MPFPMSSVLETEKAFDPSRVRLFGSQREMLGATRLSYLFEKRHVGILPCSNCLVNIGASKYLSNDRDRVDLRCLSMYYIAGLHDNY